ncbi:3-deoxy-7-phosphoheptulonate synthase [Faecalicoccus pleomorphus]|uniref:3-deoxy-7-phosphoheptulonate synthase n=1 Tax=Faecalicoccus pleomorphus TaxID=1323 RepID=A0A3E3E555_9FIRM|nr:MULTISPECIES: 3-deoxy-7-phosphoheptulonate synthase [Faecalicoccus]MDB7979092.1 3-deoxy-7-phosphoheptulonate synthase [Faecalicoccus pleomorphus]MDB7981371.1 3-deoxy-7-phosphoheptulonate synthase [Faecalicoccus pleomorphus]MDB7989538.1 3-deoxy-7-phosphoheptulonate synthase [Faecalicoccus pleomorphus]MDB7993959.1 3-deoxy-7-phosphoheptulonate synthase [Faecalicoccus pleomorphus]MDY5111889.1 3-deoxy-7-phosphoheptulonate synthase [Faecalicoccus sp.]
MIITLKKEAQQETIDQLIHRFENMGLQVTVIYGENYNVFGLVGDTSKVDEKNVMANPIVANVQRVDEPYKLVNRKFHPEDTIIDVNGIPIGGKKIVMIAGPCSVEGKEQITRIAKEVKACGADMLRGGAYKPRTSPYAFQGLGTEGVNDLCIAREQTGLPIVSELMAVEHLDEFVQNVDIIQIGARNMQNFDLLKAVGRTKKPVLLKRGLANTINEWIMAAEYIMSEGNPNVIFCERGIRTFETMTRNTLDLAVIPIIKERTHLPIIIDPSHAAGDWKLIESLSLAAIAAGADGLIIEVHDNPECAWSDGDQSLKPEKYANLIQKGRKIAEVIGREL